jgi:hypothetical protein
LELCHFVFRIETQYTLSRRLDGTGIQSGRFEQEKYLLPLLEFEPQVVQPLNVDYAMSAPSLLSTEYKVISFIPLARLNICM